MARRHKVNRALRAKQRALASVAPIEQPMPVLMINTRIVVSASHPTWGGKKGIVKWIGHRAHPLDEVAVQVAVKAPGGREILVKVSSSFLSPLMKASDERPEGMIVDAYQLAVRHGVGHKLQRLPSELPGGGPVTHAGNIETRPSAKRGKTWGQVTHERIVAERAEFALWSGLVLV